MNFTSVHLCSLGPMQHFTLFLANKLPAKSKINRRYSFSHLSKVKESKLDKWNELHVYFLVGSFICIVLYLFPWSWLLAQNEINFLTRTTTTVLKSRDGFNYTTTDYYTSCIRFIYRNSTSTFRSQWNKVKFYFGLPRKTR